MANLDVASEEREGGGSTRYAYEELRARVLNGQLEPGATFSQVQLAVQLGVSRTPLREAVRLLQTEGFLQSEPNRRVRVSALSTEDFEDLYCMRITLDSLAVRITVPLLGSDELAGIRAALERATAAAERGDLVAYHDPHRDFHFGLFAHAGPRLRARVEELWDHAERYRLLYQQHAGERTQLVQLASNDHAAILDAAERHDGSACACHMAEHLARTAITTLSRVNHRHDPARVRASLELITATASVPA